MATITYHTFRLADSETIAAFKYIAKDVEAPTATLYIHLAPNAHAFEVQLTQADQDPTVQQLLKSDGAVAHSLAVSLKSIPGSQVRVVRQSPHVEVRIDVPDQADRTRVAVLVASAQKHLKAFSGAEAVRRILGEELSEHYARREETLLRLESLAEKLIERNDAYRRQLDNEANSHKERIEQDFARRQLLLDEDYTTKRAQLGELEQSLSKRQAEFDDRDSRHVRRQIRQDLKGALAARAKEFKLTKATSNKRILIHALFTFLLVSFLALLWHTVLSKDPTIPMSLYLLRLGMGGVGFVAIAVFYIRWSDHWFRQHADEEFRLKRLELDIDRASWVVEMALEWKGEKGAEIPNELVDRLTRSLFSESDVTLPARHPSEDIVSALFHAMRTLRIAIPGLGEAEIDRRSLKKLQKSIRRDSPN